MTDTADTKVFIVAGTGRADVSTAALREALADAVAGSDDFRFVLPWAGKPTAAMAKVYDFVLENQHPYTLFAEGDSKVPSVFEDRLAARGEYAALAAQCVNGEESLVLALGSDEETDNILLQLHAHGIRGSYADLANGLVPIEIESYEPDFSALQQEVTPPEGKEEGLMLATPAEDVDTDEENPFNHRVEQAIASALRAARVEQAIASALRAARAEATDEPSRKASIVVTKLEEAFLWYRYGVADNC